MEQRELVDRVRRGDGTAFAALVGQHLRAMVELARVVGGNAADAEDIVQDSLTQTLRSIPRFDPDRPFLPWFATIVANRARNSRRSGMRRDRLAVRVSAIAAPVSEPIEDRVIADEQRDALRALLATLPQHDREVLALRFLAGLSERETAEALAISLGTVKSRTSRALARLRTMMTVEVTT